MNKPRMNLTTSQVTKMKMKKLHVQMHTERVRKTEFPPIVQSSLAAVLKMKHEIQCANAQRKVTGNLKKPKLK